MVIHAGHLIDKDRLLFASNATDADIEQYTSGECHVFAVALHRLFGWPMCAVLDNGELYWEDPEYTDNFIRSAVHVFATDPAGNAWDVMGVRKREDICEEVDTWARVLYPMLEDLFSELDLATYVGEWGEDVYGDPIDRPLDSYTEEDVQEASEKALRIFAGHPVFEAAKGASPRMSALQP